MAREALMTLDMSAYSHKISEVLQLFEKAGWHTGYDGTEYLPLGDDGMFEWEKAKLGKDEFIHIIDLKQTEGETVSVILYFEDSDRGITFLADSTESILLGLDVNRKTIDGEYTDASWYIMNIVARLERCGFIAEKFDYNEVIG